MTRTEALRRIAELHTAWSLEHGDEVPYVATDSNPHPGTRSDLPVWQADRSAPPEIDDPLNEEIKAILAQIEDEAQATSAVASANLLTFAKRRRKVTISGPTLDELDAAADAMAELVARHVGRVTGAAARQLGGVTTVTAGLLDFRQYARDEHGRFAPGGGRTAQDFDQDDLTHAATGEAALRATKVTPPDDQAAAALRSYTGSFYREVNGSLRAGKGSLPDGTSHYVRQDVAGLDRALAAGRSRRAVVVTRGITDHQVTFGDQPPRVGLTWVEHGYSSTSVSAPATLGPAFTAGKNPLRMRILVPAGTRAISTSSGRRDLLDPDEVLLDRGLTFRIVRDNGLDTYGIRRVDVEVLG